MSRPSSFSANKGRADEPAATYPERIVVELNLKAVRPECDRPESPHDNVESQDRSWSEVSQGQGLREVSHYARLRSQLGLLAARIVEEGRVRAAGSKMSKDFAQALRRLANPSLEAEAFLSNCKLVLGAMERTTLITGLFKDLPPFEGFEFIRELRFCVSGDPSGRAEVARIAKAVWRRVVVSRGPKLSCQIASNRDPLSRPILTPLAGSNPPGARHRDNQDENAPPLSLRSEGVARPRERQRRRGKILAVAMAWRGTCRVRQLAESLTQERFLNRQLVLPVSTISQ